MWSGCTIRNPPLTIVFLLSPPLAVTEDYRVAFNATVFYASILANTPLQTPILYFSVIINNTYFETLQTVNLSIVGYNRTEHDIFRFENGTIDEEILFGIDEPPPETEVVIIERPILYFNEPPENVELPSTFAFEINVLVVGDRAGRPLFEDQAALGVVDIDIIFPSENPLTCIVCTVCMCGGTRINHESCV